MQGEFGISIKTLQNLEEVLAKELLELGAKNVETGRRVVHCKGDLSFLYRANLHLRTALRILVPIAEFPIRDADNIYSQGQKIDWSEFMNVNQTFAIDPNVHSDFIKHSNYASVRLKDAIADFFTNKNGRRPDVNPTQPDVLFNLHIDNHRVTISLDSSGESLNRRGYRGAGARAPLNEVLAAGMIMLTGWKGETDMYVPMCGSGTIAIEASMIAQNLPAQFLRNDFGFMRWTNYDRETWSVVKNEARNNINVQKCKIYASDADSRQLKVARENIEEAGIEDNIVLTLADFFEEEPHGEAGTMIINPPYGERLDDVDVGALYSNIGNHLKHHWPGFSAWIISSNTDALKRFGLKPSKKFQLINGTFMCTYNRYDLFAGKRIDHIRS